MKKYFQLCFFLVLVVMLSACVNLNKKVTEDVNVLQAKVENTEKSIKKLDASNNELRDIVAGEQKRGEYLQLQLTEMVNKLHADINALESQISQKSVGRSTLTRTTRTTRSNSTRAKFVSDKMQSSPTVRDVQLSLRNAGFYDGAIDGKVGPKSKAGVKEFQRSYGLTADGVVGEKTWLKLKKYL